MSDSLQSVIAPAISKEIANNKDVMIDSLYPIMGGMISKYVSQALKEMMETITEKIEDGLSIDKYRRKIKSKVTGVSETELLLEESGHARISSLFVIHKESGLLIAEGHLADKEIDDPHMVASMASAIKDFINDWIQNNEVKNEVQILSYANETLYIEGAGSIYMIAFLDAEPDYELRMKINSFFASLVTQYATFFQKFDGDDSTPEVQMLSDKLSEYLQIQRDQKVSSKLIKNKKPMKYIFLLFALGVSVYLIYIFKGWYFEYSLENEIKEKTGQAIQIEQRDNTLEINGYVDTFEKVGEIENIVRNKSKKELINHLTIPLHYIAERMIEQENKPFLEVKEFESKIVELENKITFLENDFVVLTKENKTKTADMQKLQKDILNIADIRSDIISKLKKTFSGSQYIVQNDGSLDFNNRNLFQAKEVQVNPSDVETIFSTIEKYIATLLSDSEIKKYIQNIIIVGYTDTSGINIDNLELSRKRAYATMEYLFSLPLAEKYNLRNYLKAEGLGAHDVIMVDGVEDKEASRRIKIKFELKNSQILDKIKSMIND